MRSCSKYLRIVAVERRGAAVERRGGAVERRGSQKSTVRPLRPGRASLLEGPMGGEVGPKPSF